jgi:hypothetical protein
MLCITKIASMKTFITSFIAFFLAFGMISAQTVFINSPAELEGAYAFEAAAFGADINSDIWTGDAEFIDDGSGADASQGCGAAVNDLTDKIALIDRGSCEFGLKCLNAEEAGAIAAIVFNNQPGNGAIVMGAGVNGGSVTIPCVMLSYEDGQTIRAALEDGAVNISIGALVFANDLRLGSMDVVVAPTGTIPMSQIQGEGEFVVTPGAAPVNFGFNDAPGFNVSATIEHTVDGMTTEVYNEAGSSATLIESDSTAELVTLPPYDVFATGEGSYAINYTVNSDSTDATPSDNSFSVNFDLSSNIYSKAPIDPATGRPNTTIYRTVGGGGDVEFLSVFDVPYGEGFTIDTILCDVTTNGENLAGVLVEGFIYEWNDADEDGFFLQDEISLVGLSTFQFPDDATETTAELSMPVVDLVTFEPVGYIIPNNDAKYIIGVRYFGTELIFFGFNDNYDYNQYQQFLLANEAFTDGDYGYLLVTAWIDFLPDFENGLGLFEGLPGSALSQGITLKAPDSSVEVVGEDVFEMSIFPNPTTDVLTAQLNFKQDTDFAEYRITNVNGSVIFMNRDNEVFGEETATFNVKTLPAGQYFLTIRTEQGSQTTPFVVKH